MERTIPVFRSLIATDTVGQWHHYRGQLGYALKDRRPPESDAAVEALGEAIRLRDAAGDVGYLFYEFNRAMARIGGDTATGASADDLRETILADLRAAAEDAWIRDLIGRDERLAEWLKRNKLKAEDL
jgi:hypothetical protein